MPERQPPHVRALPVAFLLLVACTDPVDKAAKERIFSPEDPPKVVASATEQVAADRLDDDAKLARRVLRMGAAETTERLGAHKFTSNVSFAWSGSGGTVKLDESRLLIAGRGGVNGDFHGTLNNTRDQGLEVLRVGGKVYARSRYGTFRQRLRDRGMAERQREEIFGTVRDFDVIFNGRLKLGGEQAVVHDGRPAVKYTVTLAPAPEALEPEGAVTLPARPLPKDGKVDSSTERRLVFLERREPVAVDGFVVVDEQTGVVLAAKLNGRAKVPETESAPAAELRMSVAANLSDIAQEPVIAEPKEFLPDEDKPQGIADALDQFGIPRAGREKDAGTPAPAPADEAEETP